MSVLKKKKLIISLATAAAITLTVPTFSMSADIAVKKKNPNIMQKVKTTDKPTGRHLADSGHSFTDAIKALGDEDRSFSDTGESLIKSGKSIGKAGLTAIGNPKETAMQAKDNAVYVTKKAAGFIGGFFNKVAKKLEVNVEPTKPNAPNKKKELEANKL